MISLPFSIKVRNMRRAPDRYFNDGRIRNAYQSGNLLDLHNGRVRLPGWWDENEKRWCEDKGFVGTHTGNTAWSMIALISSYEVLEDRKYLTAAEKMGDWIINHTWDTRGAGGFMGGFEGWRDRQEKLLWKSTEHNLDAFVAYRRLYQLTRDSSWLKASEHAKKFLHGMWNERDGFFWTGTLEDGVTINKNVVPLDVQTWGLMALGKKERFSRGIQWAERNCFVTASPDGCKTEGYDFNSDQDGIWFEGTAQMALAYALLGEKKKYEQVIKTLRQAQNNDGSLMAACHDGVSTGFDWKYFRRAHIGATAWFIFAERRYNPFGWE